MNKSILIIEDDGIVVQVLSFMLKQRGHTIYNVLSDGENAVKLLKDSVELPDLVLMDIHLDGVLDGVETAQNIVQFADIPIVYLTASADTETIERASKSEAYGYLPKPINKESLFSTIEMAIYKHSMEKLLRQKNTQLDIILKSTQDIVWSADILLNKLIYINPVAEQIYGQSVEPFFENLSLWRNLIHPDDHVRMDMVFSEGQLTEVEYRVVQPDGTIVWLSDRISFRTNSLGKLTIMDGIARNITKQKQIQEELWRRDKDFLREQLRVQQLQRDKEIAENTAALKQQFLANMSHEIRTPMNGIIGMTDYLLQGNLSEQQRSNLSVIKRSADYLLMLLNDILDLSKLEAGKSKLYEENIEISYIILKIEDLFSLLASKKGLLFSIKIDKSVPKNIYADSKRIIQILANLIANAIKFTDKGEVGLEIKAQSIKENRILLLIEIRDSGIGIKPNDIENLFNNFTQIDDSFSRNHEGTGLGLAIVRELVTLMNGEIVVESEWGKGSVFKAQIEVHEAINILTDNSNNDIPVLPNNFNIKILLAEDKLVNQQVATLLLEHEGCTVTVANNGKEAIDLFEKEVFDLILMDIQMPICDGIQATKQLRDKYKKIPPIIAVSANALDGDKEHYIEKGLDDYLAKPIEINTLRAMLKKWIKPASINEQQMEEIFEPKEVISNWENTIIFNPKALSFTENKGNRRDILEKLFASFKEDVTEICALLAQAMQQNNIEICLREMHTLKGLCGTIGASQMYEFCKEMYEYFNGNQMEKARQLYLQISKVLENLWQYLETWLASL